MNLCVNLTYVIKRLTTWLGQDERIRLGVWTLPVITMTTASNFLMKLELRRGLGGKTQTENSDLKHRVKILNGV